MENKSNIDTQLVTYGVAVHGDTDSGWKITGFTPGIDADKGLKLSTLTSVGEISETWAMVFEHGFGYFGRMGEEDRAIFALFYRSPVKSARNRHFVPRIVLTIPYHDYVHKLNCDPIILFDYLIKYKEEKVPFQCDHYPVELEPFYDLSSPPVRSLSEQLKPLNTAIANGILTREFLIEFLTAILRPEPHCTLVWGGEKPDTALVLSMVFLLPRTLRRFITFCTNVENPKISNFRIKIIKDPISPENNSFVVMNESRCTLRKSPLPFETQLPGIIVAELMDQREVGIISLSEMQEFIDTKLGAEPGISMNFKKILKKTGILAELYLLRKQVKTAQQTDSMFKQLVKYHLKLDALKREHLFETEQSMEEECRFVVNQFEKGVQEIKNEAQMKEVIEELNKLAQNLPGLKEKDNERLSQTLFAKGEELPLNVFLPILKAFYNIPTMKETIDAGLFKQLKLKQDPGWEESFELLTMACNLSQCMDLKVKNKKLYNQLKAQPGLDFFIDLLSLVLPGKESNIRVPYTACKKLEKIGKEDTEKIHKIIFWGFKRIGEFETGEHYIPFLFAAAHAYAMIRDIGTEAQQDFQSQFNQRFYQLCHLKLDQQKKNLVIKISAQIKAADEQFTNQLAIIMKQGDFFSHLAACNNLLTKENTITFKEKGDVHKFLRQLDENSVSRSHRCLSTAALQLILGNNILPAPTIYGDYLDYLKLKKGLDDTDIKNIITILLHDPSPMGYFDHLLDTLTIAFSRCSEQSLGRFVRTLLDFAQNYTRGKIPYISEIEKPFTRIVSENWKPSTGEEVREMYQAVNGGFGKLLGNRILGIGFVRLSNEEKMKYFTGVLSELFSEFSLISRDDQGYFKELLTCIDSEKPEHLLILIHLQAELMKIKEDKEAMEESMEKIKTLLKKLKKIKTA
jgi:hypothetical protein